MTKIAISIVVGAVITFMVQSLSWTVLPIHANSFKYAEQQDAIMEVLNSNLTEDGYYAIPMPPPELKGKEQQEYQKNSAGKPWAMVNYHKELNENMGVNMLLGFLMCLLGASLITMVMYFTRMCQPSFWIRFFMAFSFFAFILFMNILSNAVWFSTPGHFLSGEVIDIVLSGGLASTWYAWFNGWTGMSW